MTENGIDVAFGKFITERNGRDGQAEREAFATAVRACLRAQAMRHDSEVGQAGEQITSVATELEQTKQMVGFLRAEATKARNERAEAAERNAELAAEIARLKGEATTNADRTAEAVAGVAATVASVVEERDAARAEVARLEERQAAHLQQIARLSQTVPLEGEVAEALAQRGALLAEVGTLRAKIEQMRLAGPGWQIDGMETAVDLALAESVRARELHSESLENAKRSDDYRLRVLTEEVGEVASAIEMVEVAERDELANRRGRHPDDEDASWSPRDAANHMTDELVQVASAALRWIALRVATRG